MSGKSLSTFPRHALSRIFCLCTSCNFLALRGILGKGSERGLSIRLNNAARHDEFGRVFRAQGASACLVISDWKSPTEAGGPIGQKVLFSGVRIEPYFQD